jgi:hypothetical protein
VILWPCKVSSITDPSSTTRTVVRYRQLAIPIYPSVTTKERYRPLLRPYRPLKSLPLYMVCRPLSATIDHSRRLSTLTTVDHSWPLSTTFDPRDYYRPLPTTIDHYRPLSTTRDHYSSGQDRRLSTSIDYYRPLSITLDHFLWLLSTTISHYPPPSSLLSTLGH